MRDGLLLAILAFSLFVLLSPRPIRPDTPQQQSDASIDDGARRRGITDELADGQQLGMKRDGIPMGDDQQVEGLFSKGVLRP